MQNKIGKVIDKEEMKDAFKRIEEIYPVKNTPIGVLFPFLKCCRNARKLKDVEISKVSFDKAVSIQDQIKKGDEELKKLAEEEKILPPIV